MRGRYRGRHRQVGQHQRLRAALTVAAITGSALVAPIAVSGSAVSNAAVRLPVPSFTEYDRAEWLTAPDIAVNPPGVTPGNVVAPAVERGYVITGDHLHRFEITGTPEATAELRALVERVGADAHGQPLDTTGYRVFATPPIVHVQYIEAMKHVMTLVGAVGAVIDVATDPALVQDLKDALYEQAPTIQGDDPLTSVQTVEGLVAYVTDPAFVQGLKDALDEHEPSLPPGTVETIRGLASSTVDLVTSVIPDPAVLVPLAEGLIAQHMAALSDGSLPININDEPESILADLTHLAPVGTDVLGVDDTVSDQGLAEVFVLPVGVGVGEIGAAWDDGRLAVSTVVQETPAAMADSLIAQVPAPEAAWDAQPIHCYHRKSNNTAWFDPCYQYASLAKDGDPNRVAWTHHQKGLGKSKSGWTLVNLTVKSSRKVGSPDQQWQDWSPNADIEAGNCGQTQVGITVNGFGWSKYFTHCDLWDISKANPAVNFAVKWDGRAWRKDRYVASMKTASIPNGYAPVNVVRYDYEAW